MPPLGDLPPKEKKLLGEMIVRANRQRVVQPIFVPASIAQAVREAGIPANCAEVEPLPDTSEP